MSGSAHPEEATYWNVQAVELQRRGLSREALQSFQKALEIHRDLGDRKGEARCLNGVGALLKDLGRLPEARESLEQALVLRRQVGDRLGELVTLTTLGPVYQGLGQPEAAEEVLSSAVLLSRHLPYRSRAGQALFNLGAIQEAQGRLGPAWDSFSQALAIATEVQDMAEEIKCLNALASLSRSLGRLREGIRHATASLARSLYTCNPRGESAARHNLGMLLESAGRYTAAEKAFEKSLAIDAATAPDEAPVTMLGLGLLYLHHRRRLARARELADEALPLAELHGHRALVAGALRLKAEVLLLEGKAGPACELLSRAREIAHQARERLVEAHVTSALAVAHWELGERDRAFEMFEAAASFTDATRAEIGEPAHRLSFFDQLQTQGIYYVYIARLLRAALDTGDCEHAERAFDVCERRRARSLLDALAGSAVPDRPVLAPISLRDTRMELLGKETALVKYSVHADAVHVWTLTDEAWTAEALPVSGLDLREQVREIRQLIEHGDLVAFARAAHSLYRLLLAPSERLLEGRENLIVIPDGPLHLVPFQLLLTAPAAGEPAPGETVPASERDVRPRRSSSAGEGLDGGELPYLLRRHRIICAPSATALVALRRRGAERSWETATTFAALAPVELDGRGLPDLPGTRREVCEIAALMPSGEARVFFGGEATRELVLSGALGRHRFVHFVTHAHGSDRGSFLLLADGTLTDRDIAGLDFQAELVVLSACETALGQRTHSEGILGLARAFLAAGSSAVCGSLWKMHDEATAELMRRFYVNILAGASFPAALQKAQLQMLEGGRYSHPRLWAGAILVGGRP